MIFTIGDVITSLGSWQVLNAQVNKGCSLHCRTPEVCAHASRSLGARIQATSFLCVYRSLPWCMHSSHSICVRIQVTRLVHAFRSFSWCTHSVPFLGAHIKVTLLVHAFRSLFWCMHSSGVTLHVGAPPHRQRPPFWRPSPT